MIRVRVSTLESFRRLFETDYGDEAELIDYVRRGQDGGPTRWQMEAGTAWHDCVANPLTGEHGPDGTITHYRSGEYWFAAPAVDESRAHYGPGRFEVTRSKAFPAGGGRAWVKGTADHVRGLTVQDGKTKFSAIDARDYERSLQWRFYLLLHDCQEFRYNLFDMKDPDDTGFIELRNVVSFSFWKYHGMEADCESWLTRFAEWAGDRGLLADLRRYGLKPQPA